MKRIFLPFVIVLSTLLVSCFPTDLKEKMGESMTKAQEMLFDKEFKSAIANIELHKIRTGEYPEKLSDIRFLSAFDSSYVNIVSYKKLDSVYKLDLKSMNDLELNGQKIEVKIEYSKEFWEGLGCVESNLMKVV
ncbi:MAG: hypothetical protein ACPGLV_15810 [Bacteroidia bacterium]